jgi:hypothetical protein
MEEYKLTVSENGDISAERELSDGERESKLEKIHAMIEDEETSPGKIKRAIAAELAKVNRIMVRYGNDTSILEGMKIKALSEQVKALRELGKEVMEADVLSHKDYLNWEGKKFQFAIKQYTEGLVQAMKIARLDESTINSVLSHWRDIMQSNEQDIRRMIDRMDSK